MNFHPVTSTHVDQEEHKTYIEQDPIIISKPVEVPGWYHINPISTQIDLDSVAYQLSNYKYTEGMTVTKEDLTNPKFTDYKATPKYK